jgi:DNA invertase Pin-like site-specific DNA recombinase
MVGMKSKAYSYVRFSTADQIKGDSLRRQTEATAEWCKRHDVELVESYHDLGVSAFRGKNAEIGALKKFLDLACAGRIEKGSYLVVESLDRLSRNAILDAFELFLGIIKTGVVVVTLSDQHVYDKAKINDGNFTDLIISLTVLSRANEESRTKSQRIGAAWRNKRARVEEEKLTSICVGWLRLGEDRKHFEQIPERVKVVKRIFELAQNGKGAHGITTILRSERVEPFGRGYTWHVSYVRKILESRATIGELIPTERQNGEAKPLDPIPNYYPAIISREAFATVQQLRKARPNLRGKSSDRNAFSKLAFDPAGNTMVYINRTPKNLPDPAQRYEYLVSYGALVNRAKYITWRYDEFLALFLLVCQQAALQPAQKDEPNGGKLDLARMELADTEKQIARCADFILKGASPAIEARMRELEAQRGKLQTSITDLESEVLAKPTSPSKVNWKDSAALRENLRATVKRITVDAAKKSFKAEFLDGRTYTLAVEKGMANITCPDGFDQRAILRRQVA